LAFIIRIGLVNFLNPYIPFERISVTISKHETPIEHIQSLLKHKATNLICEFKLWAIQLG